MDECDTVTELSGNEADAFAQSHLVERWVNGVVGLVGYECLSTQRLWVRDSPQSHLQGGGPPRLRQVTNAVWAASQPRG
jgi:hypothetical protein